MCSRGLAWVFTFTPFVASSLCGQEKSSTALGIFTGTGKIMVHLLDSTSRIMSIVCIEH